MKALRERGDLSAAQFAEKMKQATSRATW